MWDFDAYILTMTRHEVLLILGALERAARFHRIKERTLRGRKTVAEHSATAARLETISKTISEAK